MFRVGPGLIVAGRLAGEVRRGRLVPEPWPEHRGYPPLTEDEMLERMTYPS